MRKLESIRASRSRSASVLCLSLVLFAPIAGAQTHGAALSRATLTASGDATLDLSRLNPSDLLREIDDPALGRRWLLYRDPRHPQGPGRLVAERVPSLDRSHPASTRSQNAGVARLPVIRAGDRVILEENTPTVEARLEAIALVPAFRGSPIRVRLVLGGRIVDAIAEAPGRVELVPRPESQP